MKKILFLLVWIFPLISFSQTFEQDGDMEVPEDTSYHCSTINVDGVGVLSDIHGLEKVCVVIESYDDGDLSIALVDPNGNVYYLSTNNGGSGNDYGSSGWGTDYTCFTMNASTSIVDGSPDYEGDFKPEDDLALVNNLQDGDGVWRLCLMDNNDNGSDVKLDDWTLTFSDNPPNHITRITHDCSSSADDYFYDLGGPDSNYSPGEIHYWVICPSDTNMDVGLDFEEWDVEDSVMDDHLTIWNDTSTVKDPYMDAGDVEGATLDNILARADNPSGCLTFRWVSDSDTLVGSGWKAKISCYVECQQVNFKWDALSLNNEDTNYIAICQGQSVTFKAHGVYPENDDKYHQDDGTSTFKWSFGDGSFAEGSTVTHTYDTAKGYQVELQLTDVMGCPSHLDLGKRVIVSLAPTFTGTKPQEDSICNQQCTDLLPQVQMYEWKDSLAPPVLDTTVLPDGNGVYYYSQIEFQTFRPGDTISDGSQIDSMMMNIEHSYVGDVVVWLICPDGTTVQLFDGNNYPQLGDFLGKPGSDDGTPDFPGIGWTYSFTDSASTLFKDAPEVPDTTIDGTVHNGVKPGIYKPVNSFDNFIGCPLNGKWIIKINDDQSSDDGYLFSWWIDFADSLYHDTWGYHMAVADSTWDGINGTTVDNSTNPAKGCVARVGDNQFRYTITDNFGCSYDTVITIVGTGVDFDLSESDVKCHGGNDGEVNLTVTDGSPTHYDWKLPDGTTGGEDNTATSKSWSSLSAGTFYVTVKNAEGCENTQSITISEPPAINLTMSPTDVSCHGDGNGAIDLTVSGGTPNTTGDPYSYHWDDGSNTEDLANLGPGTYKVTVTDHNACTATKMVTISEPDAIVITVDSTKNSSCGNADGAIYTTSSGGQGGLTNSWSNGATTDDITGLVAGTYTDTVKDSKGCLATVAVPISDEGSPTIVEESSLHINVRCNGLSTGQAAVSATGGTGSLTYKWSTSSTDTIVKSLAAGTYSVTVKDGNGCEANISIDITEPPKLTTTIQTYPVRCHGDATGGIVARPAGGTPKTSTPLYIYNWSGPSSYSSTDSTDTTVIAGTYYLTVTDDSGCTVIDTAEVTEPDLLVLSTLVDSVDCYGNATGSVDLTVTGGVTDYKYQWDNDGIADDDDLQDLSNLTAGTYAVTVTDHNGCTKNTSVTVYQPDDLVLTINNVDSVKCYGEANGAIDLEVVGGIKNYTYNWTNSDTTQDLSNLTAGTYKVTVTDHNGCTDTVSAKIYQPDDLVLTVDSIDSVRCYGQHNGAIYINVTGGITNYRYDWDNDGVADTNDTQDLTSLVAGNYHVTVVDHNGCTKNTSVTVYQPTQLLFDTLVHDESCPGANDGSIIITPHGGIATYSYAWSKAGESDSTLDSLVGGNDYSVTVTDHNSCTNSQTIHVNQGTGLDIAINVPVDKQCLFNNDFTFDANGSSPGTYYWTFGDSKDSTHTVASGATTEEYQFHHSYVDSGDYAIHLKIDNGICSAVFDSVNIHVYPQPELSLTGTNILCYGDSSGKVVPTVNNAVAPMSFVWSNGDTTDSLVGVPVGTYYGAVVDAHHCADTNSVTLTQPPKLVFSSTKVDLRCYNDNSGSITTSASGGVTDYHYTWNTGATTASLSNIPAGTYEVTITDDNGCQDSIKSIQVTQPDSLMLIVDSLVNPRCSYSNDGHIAVHAEGGVADYSYKWSSGATTHSIDVMKTNTFFVTATDNHGCEVASDSLPVVVPSPIVIIADTTIDATNHVGNIEVSVSGGTPGYSYSWENMNGNFSSTDEDLHNIGGGAYYLTVTDAHGCIDTVEREIIIPLIIPTIFTPNGDGFNDKWRIVNIESYKKVHIEIYDRWGDMVFTYDGTGYSYFDPKNQWDGTYNGKPLPVTSYVYIVVINDDKDYNGIVTILR